MRHTQRHTHPIKRFKCILHFVSGRFPHFATHRPPPTCSLFVADNHRTSDNNPDGFPRFFFLLLLLFPSVSPIFVDFVLLFKQTQFQRPEKFIYIWLYGRIEVNYRFIMHRSIGLEELYQKTFGSNSIGPRVRPQIIWWKSPKESADSRTLSSFFCRTLRPTVRDVKEKM